VSNIIEFHAHIYISNTAPSTAPTKLPPAHPKLILSPAFSPAKLPPLAVACGTPLLVLAPSTAPVTHVKSNNAQLVPNRLICAPPPPDGADIVGNTVIVKGSSSSTDEEGADCCAGGMKPLPERREGSAEASEGGEGSGVMIRGSIAIGVVGVARGVEVRGVGLVAMLGACA